MRLLPNHHNNTVRVTKQSFLVYNKVHQNKSSVPWGFLSCGSTEINPRIFRQLQNIARLNIIRLSLHGCIRMQYLTVTRGDF